MRLFFILVLPFLVLGCAKTDVEKCVDAQLAKYDALKKNSKSRFEKKYCSTDGCYTREEQEAHWSFHCLRAANLKTLQQ